MFAVLNWLISCLLEVGRKQTNSCAYPMIVCVCLCISQLVVIIVFGPVLLLLFKTLLSHCALLNDFDHFGKVHYT